MIDSHLNSSRRSRLCQQYRQIKELQKAISTGIETIASKYSQANRQINKLTEQIINQIKKRQKATFTALQKQKLQIIQKIDKNWGDFKGYALVMRRIYFGQSQSQKLPPFNLQSMKEILLELNKKENKIGQLVNNFRRLHENISQKEEKYLQQRYHQSQQFKPMTQKDIDISPIKLKKRENNTNVQKNNEYEHINHSKILLFQECFKQSEHKNDSQFKLFNAQNDQKNSENQQTRNLPSKVTHQLEKLKMSKPLIQNYDKIISLSSAKSDDRQFSNRLKAVKSSDRVYSANIMSNFSAKVMSNARSQRQLNYPNYSHKNSYLQYKNKNSQRVYFCEKSQLFSQKQQKSLVKRSYKGCLQKLQKQQLQYEKIRHTFQ